MKNTPDTNPRYTLAMPPGEAPKTVFGVGPSYMPGFVRCQTEDGTVLEVTPNRLTLLIHEQSSVPRSPQ